MQHAGTCSGSRRSFLRGCGLTLAGFGLTSLFPTPFIRHALASGPADGRRFMFIFLRGGNDGLNAVIPHGDLDYNATTRPTLYISPTEAIDLNGFASLHPALGAMMDLFNAGELALVHRVGYADNSRSHFDGQRIWENGDPTQTQLFQGWLYRYIQEHAVSAGVDLPALTVQKASPILLRGEESFVNVANPDSFDYEILEPARTKFASGWRTIHANLQGLGYYRPVLSQTGVKLLDTLDEYASWDQVNWNPRDPVSLESLFPVSDETNPDDPSGPGGKKFSSSSYDFFRSLKVCALALLESDGSNNGTRTSGTELGGWDTHNSQGGLNGTQAELFSWLAYGFRSLHIVLSGAANDTRSYPNIWNDTIISTMSEFGRTSGENGSAGTDHAAASCLFAAGGCVNGGVYNCTDENDWPEGVMFGVNDRYLLERTDYRAIFWEILRDHMGASPAAVDTMFPSYTALGLGAQEPGLINCPSADPVYQERGHRRAGARG